ncbi:baseplate J/gp47 family protein [Phormidium tenue]|uniref:Uncharacterized protein n=1 Tax=Phormidium tenue NIES-30 TaxID=549789 RepID=A0A1U7J4T4_9CYAN|nr:baseplate J/gp47 family protein [Phormidium tenue]MBD2232785.1 baseplate J/gp47 family protein [Phormidium tenue FACHB-1052]OKH47524.1 hypothetical protein NIES30_13790 [Phormidium tenue NIES-30]
MTILNPEALAERANNLGSFNGMELVLVELTPAIAPTEAHLLVHFFNNQELADIVADVTADPALARQIFTITGGQRIRGGDLAGEVQVVAVAATSDPNVLDLTVTPIGDYSTYTLSLDRENIDPIFSELPFKFRPGCFTNNCAPDWEPGAAPLDNPTIDYLAKDYDSFRHTLMAAMAQRVPGWQPTSEADLDQVLLSLFSAAADELSDFQDRVMGEAYWSTLRKRVSLARHARLVDYHVHQGNQASTWLALILGAGESLELPKPHPVLPDVALPLLVWAGSPDFNEPVAVVFMSQPPLGEPQQLDSLVNQMGLYTWDGAIPALAAGSTQADLLLLANGPDGPGIPIVDEASARQVEDLVRTGKIPTLLIQERLNPATGELAGRNPNKRQLLRLLPGAAGATAKLDPLRTIWYVEVHWRQEDALRFNYCFTVGCAGGAIEHVSLFHGNLVPVHHGRPREILFEEPVAPLDEGRFYFERTDRWGTLCRLPAEPLAYQNTLPGGEIPPLSTLAVEVITEGQADPWDEVIDLIHSDDSAENGDRFMVEIDELGQSLLRFGNGINGRALPPNAQVRCRYQVGRGLDGNIGYDQLQFFNGGTYPEILACWNPFDVVDGRAPEPAAEVLRRAPEAYRFRQLRAVTLKDYVHRAEELAGVSRAAARYAWTGSWRTVQIAIDPVGTTTLSRELREKLARHLDAVRLIGEDLEIRPPRFVPLDIQVALCIHPDYWPEDIRFVLEQEFSDGYTPDGRLGFFHPDLWTFGQPLYASQIAGRVQAVAGVEHVISMVLKRWNEATPGTEAIATLRPNEIIQVRNDPDHQEMGAIAFDIRGGRQ